MKQSLLATRKNYNIGLIVFFISILLPFESFGQKDQIKEGAYYQKIFQGRYDDALQFLDDNSWISDSLEKNGIDPNFAIAIIFPELIRYSSIKDKMELGGLLTLYVQYGEKYADFSVGRFQMKPTFAELLEKDFNSKHSYIKIKFNNSNTIEARIERIKRLSDIKWQVNYLAMFLNIMDTRYSEIRWESQEEKLRFYATAYNSGYKLSKEKIKQHICYNMFYTGLVKPDSCYNYADIVLDYFYKSKASK